MRRYGQKTARRAAAWLRSRFRPTALILGYHRIAATAVDPYSLCVSPDHFAQQLDVLCRVANVIDLETLRHELLNGSLPERAVAITFDDGYQDNLVTALPLLAARQLPATVFVVSGTLGQEFWWDMLARLIFETAVLPDTLTLQSGEQTIQWTVPDPADSTLQKDGHSPRHHLFHQLYSQMIKLKVEERPSFLAQIQTWASANHPLVAAHTLAMTPSELQTLAVNKLITIGAHTISHPPLGQLPTATQREEIIGSKTSLESLIKQPIPFFSYPHGDSALAVQQLVQAAGFRLACTSGNDVVFPSSNLYCLPRFWPADMDGDRFARWLRPWLKN